MRYKDLSGIQFGRLLALEKVGEKRHGRSVFAVWLCQCSCGNVITVLGSSLSSGHTKSCGCLYKEISQDVGNRLRTKVTRHGGSNTSEYYIYHHMLDRCYNKNDKRFENYGGRGIWVCDRWKGEKGFQNFLIDMGKRPKGLTLDRRDNEDGYSPSNCRWVDIVTQNNNRRPRRWAKKPSTVV